MRTHTLMTVMAAAACLGTAAHAQQTSRLTTELVADGFTAPVLAISPAGDAERLFVVEQSGTIQIIKNGVLLNEPFLDISDKVLFFLEQGLLGLAFDPDFDTNRYIYVNYVAPTQTTFVSRFEVLADDPDKVDESSEYVIARIPQPHRNHNGGMIAFGPNDGYLYVGMGDGGSSNDPDNRAQDITDEFMGKMLRLDVRSDDFPQDPDRNYAIPPSNPFVGLTGDDEIWAFGLRNPWRWCFDPANGDLYIADVGQSAREEVSFQPAASTGGENYGWRCMEGFRCTGLTGCTCNDVDLTLPIHDYTHGDGCSITGGFVYRGESIPLLRGTYFFADYCAATIWSLEYDGSNVTNFTDRTSELDPEGSQSIRGITAFGQDDSNEVYIFDANDGELFKIVTAMQVASTDLKAGDQAYFQATGATADANVFFAYSTNGLGDTVVQALDVRLGIANPKLIGKKKANIDGVATLGVRVPGNASGVTVWVQAAEIGNTSNVITQTVQ